MSGGSRCPTKKCFSLSWPPPDPAPPLIWVLAEAGCRGRERLRCPLFHLRFPTSSGRGSTHRHRRTFALAATLRGFILLLRAVRRRRAKKGKLIEDLKASGRDYLIIPGRFLSQLDGAAISVRLYSGMRGPSISISRYFRFFHLDIPAEHRLRCPGPGTQRRSPKRPRVRGSILNGDGRELHRNFSFYRLGLFRRGRPLFVSGSGRLCAPVSLFAISAALPPRPWLELPQLRVSDVREQPQRAALSRSQRLFRAFRSSTASSRLFP